MSYEKGEARIHKSPWDNKPIISLPHSCDEWEIGGVKEAQTLIDDLKKLIAELEKSTTTTFIAPGSGVPLSAIQVKRKEYDEKM